MALKGIKVVEMAGLAPAPLAGMILADFGASVIRVDKTNQLPVTILDRNKRSLAVNLKYKAGADVVKRLCMKADVFLECYRPGVMEKVGLGPDIMLALNKRLIYARLTGFGQNGSLANRAGHDINYLAISGVLSMLGRKNEPPYAPINLLADFAGGSLTCVIGILMALFERQTSNEGQVVDCSMVEGCAYLASFLCAKEMDIWTGTRGEGMLNGGAPFYDTYKTSDGKYMSVGSLEPQFYQALLQGLGIEDESLSHQLDKSKWENMKERFRKIFLSKSRAEWTNIFSKLDACVEPVLEMQEASEHDHNVERGVFEKISTSSAYEAMPAPKLLRTPAKPGSFKKPEIGEHTVDILREIDYSEKEIEDLKQTSVIYQAQTLSKL